MDWVGDGECSFFFSHLVFFFFFKFSILLKGLEMQVSRNNSDRVWWGCFGGKQRVGFVLLLFCFF